MPEKQRPKNRIFVPSDFGEVIQNIPEECPLVGGQAVAWWAHAFCPSDKPLTSCDTGDLPEEDRRRLQNFLERRWPQVEDQSFPKPDGFLAIP
jgi:hypothetical protein